MQVCSTTSIRLQLPSQQALRRPGLRPLLAAHASHSEPPDCTPPHSLPSCACGRAHKGVWLLTFRVIRMVCQIGPFQSGLAAAVQMPSADLGTFRSGIARVKRANI